MAEVTTETVTRTIHRWIVPAAEPWGAAAADIGKAWTAAENAYREHFEIPDDRPLHDDALRFHVRDEEIVIEFAADVMTRPPQRWQPDDGSDGHIHHGFAEPDGEATAQPRSDHESGR